MGQQTSSWGQKLTKKLRPLCGVASHIGKGVVLPTVDNLRCAKKAWCFWLGASPNWVRSNQPLIPSVAVVEEVSQSSNETIEAYTGHHIGRKRDRTLWSLIQPRQVQQSRRRWSRRCRSQYRATVKGEVAEGLPGSPKSVACVKRNTRELGRPNSFLVCSEVSKPTN